MLDRLIELVIRFLAVFQFVVVINEFERGVVLRLGKYHHTIGPGLHWLIPFYVDRYNYANVVPESYDMRAQGLTTTDDVQVHIGLVLFYGISDIKKFVLTVEDAESVLKNASKLVLSALVMDYSWDELVSMDIPQEIVEDICERAAKYGIDVIEVGISDFCKARTLRIMGFET